MACDGDVCSDSGSLVRFAGQARWFYREQGYVLPKDAGHHSTEDFLKLQNPKEAVDVVPHVLFLCFASPCCGSLLARVTPARGFKD